MSVNGLDSIADQSGRFAVLAMDQRGTLRRMLTKVDMPREDADLRAFKVDVIGALSPLSSGVLLDPEYGVPAVREAGALAPGTGLLVAAEPVDKEKYNGEYRTVVDPQRNAAWVRSLTGDALKFLVYWDPDRPADEVDLAAETMSAVEGIVADCRAQGVPSVIEPLVSFPPGAPEPSPDQRYAAVIRSAERLAALNPDVLKLEWPGDAAGCKAVTGALGDVPWALLSAGVEYPEFVERTKTALDNGASGFIAGRAIWGEAVSLLGEERRAFLAGTAVPRLEGLLDALSGRGRSWRETRA
jgi:tagatose-1,6-bisphosphate aldolase